MNNPFPADLQHIAALIDAQPPGVREVFHYALVMMMVDDEKAKIIGVRLKNEREILSVTTFEGEVFEIVRPKMSEESERTLRQQIWEILEDDQKKE